MKKYSVHCVICEWFM